MGAPSPTAAATPTELVETAARKKWGVSANAGFQIVPDTLFRCQKLLGLDAVDVVIILNITLHQWYDDLPYPRPSIIAKRMAVSTRTVERHIESLEKKGFMRRLPSRAKKGKMIRPFDLSGLKSKLERYAAVNLERRAHSWGV
jgi:hypothetical protein